MFSWGNVRWGIVRRGIGQVGDYQRETFRESKTTWRITLSLL